MVFKKDCPSGVSRSLFTGGRKHRAEGSRIRPKLATASMGRSSRVRHEIYDLRREILHHIQIPSPNTNSPAISPSRGFLTECALFLIEKPSPNGTFGSGVATGIGGHHPPWVGSAVSNECHQTNPDPVGTVSGFHRGRSSSHCGC
jgi:hypothetical protein